MKSSRIVSDKLKHIGHQDQIALRFAEGNRAGTITKAAKIKQRRNMPGVKIGLLDDCPR